MSNKKEHNKLVPELRFSEFENDGSWEGKPLKNVGKIITGSTPKTSERNYYNGETMFVSPADIAEGRYVSKTKTTLSKLGFSKTRPIKRNSVLFVCIGSTIGKVAQNRDECATNQQINSIVPFDDYSNEFIYSALEYNAARIASFAGIQAVPIINKSQFSDVSIYFPPTLTEQQKIANTLTSLDHWIGAENEKLEALKAHKKGLLQQLFPGKGERVPKLRFGEFEGEWEEKELGDEDVSKIIMGSSPKSTFYNKEKLGLPLLQGNADIKNRLSCPRIFTSQVTKECQINDILLSVRAPVGTVAKSNHHACIGRGIAAIRANKDNSQEFLYQWLISFEPYWKNISQGGTFDAVNSDDIRKLPIPIPKPDEQQKIAACLSSLDDLIAAQSEKIEGLEVHKKGLMQGMFPNV